MAVIVNYALQVCDTAYNTAKVRYCGENKTEVTIKCVTSFLESLKYAADYEPLCQHNLMIFEDKSSDIVKEFLIRLQKHYTSLNLKINITSVNTSGVMESIRLCWEWLRDQPGDIVYQVQDDYLYAKTGIFEMIDMFLQIHTDVKVQPFIYSTNAPFYWQEYYRYKPTPRVVMLGKKQYWIQCYDIACNFMAGRHEFNKHWDIYEKFLRIDPKVGKNGNLENITLNRIITDRKVFCAMPIQSVALHIQYEFEKDPYIDWESWWNSVPVI